MRIGFDLDGTLCGIEVAVLRMVDNLANKETQSHIEEYYYKERKPTFNARLLLHEEDEMYIITSRPKRLEGITKAWVKKYYPEAKLYICDYPPPFGVNSNKKLTEWLLNKQKDKAKVLNKLKLDVYFDDDAQVPILRKLCPDIKILQYGGRF